MQKKVRSTVKATVLGTDVTLNINMTTTSSILLALLCAFSAQVTAIPVAEECTNGPEMWCKDLQTAFQCGKVKHCLQTVWQDRESDDRLCNDCKTLITTLGDMIQDPEFENTLKNYLKQGCKLIPNPSLADQCNQMVDQYLPIIITFIQGQVNPDAICKMIGLCKGALSQEKEQIPLIHLFPAVSEPLFQHSPGQTVTEDIDACALCKQAVQIVSQVLSNEAFQKAMRMYLHFICKMLPSPDLASKCDIFADQYFPMIISFLQSQMNPDALCTLLHLCMSSESMEHAPLPSHIEESIAAIGRSPYLFQFRQTDSEVPHSADFFPQCTLCLFLMKRVEAMIPKQTLFELLGRACNLLPHMLTDVCTELKDTFGMRVVEFILSKLGPSTICTLLHMCYFTEDQYAPELYPQILMVNDDCGICQHLTQSVKRTVGKNATEVEIIAAVENGCSDSLNDLIKCDKFLQTYQPQMVKLATKPWDVETTCKEIGACTPMKETLLGTKDCSWGPSYWCKDKETAAKCKAIQYCTMRIWI
ncbi:prosaposin-like isoform X2 [Protopterus annectens]|uniref:prosaposin-like isoform X2 n=1 Tax=Protopterus annectens TaxID=7888 RepID=UPI001CFC4590|nr:prosaposin-like isoform X2 [Protopterus annectens]